jgi:hypothetical protein
MAYISQETVGIEGFSETMFMQLGGEKFVMVKIRSI